MTTTNTAALVQRLHDALEAAMGDLVEPRATWGLGAVHAASTAIATADQWLAEQPTNQCGETCGRAKLCATCAGELNLPLQQQLRTDCGEAGHDEGKCGNAACLGARAYMDTPVTESERAAVAAKHQRPRKETRDWCTDPDNCKRCKAPAWDQVNQSHAGIPIGTQKTANAGVERFPDT